MPVPTPQQGEPASAATPEVPTRASDTQGKVIHLIHQIAGEHSIKADRKAAADAIPLPQRREVSEFELRHVGAQFDGYIDTDSDCPTTWYICRELTRNEFACTEEDERNGE